MQEDSDPSGKPRPTEAGRSVPQEKWRLRRDGGAGDMEVQEIWRLRRDGGAGSISPQLESSIPCPRRGRPLRWLSSNTALDQWTLLVQLDLNSLRDRIDLAVSAAKCPG